MEKQITFTGKITSDEAEIAQWFFKEGEAFKKGECLLHLFLNHSDLHLR
jgi:hypothetical protein